MIGTFSGARLLAAEIGAQKSSASSLGLDNARNSAAATVTAAGATTAASASTDRIGTLASLSGDTRFD